MSVRDLFPVEPEPDAQQQPEILSVAELTAQIADLLESSFPTVWVAGEISNLARPGSGHCYLTLKDDLVWKTRMSRFERVLSGIVTGLLARKYGYRAGREGDG